MWEGVNLQCVISYDSTFVIIIIVDIYIYIYMYIIYIYKYMECNHGILWNTMEILWNIHNRHEHKIVLRMKIMRTYVIVYVYDYV